MKKLYALTVMLLLLRTVVSRPPTPEEELLELEISDAKTDYDTLPAYRYFPERVQQMLRNEKLRYLQFLQQHSL